MEVKMEEQVRADHINDDHKKEEEEEDMLMKQQPKKKKQQQQQQQQQESSQISEMKPVTEGAYGGGLYGTEKGMKEERRRRPASDTQSADGPVLSTSTTTADVEPKHKPPPSSGDRDIDITGQSYIQ